MKSIYSEAKQHLSSCMLQAGAADDSPPTMLLTEDSTKRLCSKNTKKHINNNYNNNSDSDSNTFIFSAAAGATAAATTTAATNYDTSQSKFMIDRKRGRWSSTVDFYCACTSHAFGSVVFSELPVYALLFGGVYFLPAYLIAILLYAVPIFVIQTFMGQFSSSGTISAFRVAPIFKGIGYSALVLNITSLTYYGVIAGVPLIYAANALRPAIPWMRCGNAWNSRNCSVHSAYDEEDEFQYPHATVEFFHSIIRSADDGKSRFHLSWPVVWATTGTWVLTLCLLLQRVSFIGKFFRCCCIVMLSVFLAIFVHLLMHERVGWSTFLSYFEPTLANSQQAIGASFRAATLMATWLLGPGWGNVLTLASFNNFRRDSERLTYWASLTHVVLAVMAMICGRVALDHFEDHVGFLHYHVEEEHYMQFLYLCFAYLFGSFSSLPNFWSFLFFGMLFLAELNAVVIQMMSVITSVLDEFERLRSRRTLITIGFAVTMMSVSAYFCTKQGFEHLHVLPTIAILSHVTISIVLLLMTTWIYGRERFQCDLQFMLGKTISNFKILLIRFVTPAFLIIHVFQILFFLEQDEAPSTLVIVCQSVVYVIAPVYMVHKMCQTRGSLLQRLQQCFQPHDWHPVDADNRRFYEEVMGTSEMLVIDSEQQYMSNDC